MKPVAVGCDPNAVELKEAIKAHLTDLGYSWEDYGSADPVYANVAITVAEAVAHGKHERGIHICGTGIGMSIAANKVPGAYAALVSDAYSAERARKSNNANIMTLGALVVGTALARTLVTTWMKSEYAAGGPSEPKVQRICEYERSRAGGNQMSPLLPDEVACLEAAALRMRRNIVRMVRAGGAGHAGGALSSTDILAALYFSVLRIDPKNPAWADRDRLVLSAGHKCMALYAALAQRGFFDEALLDTYGSLNSRLSGHPVMGKLPGVEASTGALGHGLSIAGGMAMGLRLKGISAKVYVVMGDGELAEGSNWEAAAAASHHKLDNLLVFVDRNGLQISGKTTSVMSYEPLADRWASFGWAVRRIDGHDFNQIVGNAREMPFQSGKPSVIIADTVKSKGLPFAEGKVEYHYWKPKGNELQEAESGLAALEAAGQRG